MIHRLMFCFVYSVMIDKGCLTHTYLNELKNENYIYFKRNEKKIIIEIQRKVSEY